MDRMMSGMGLIDILVIFVLVLVTVALVKPLKKIAAVCD